jgi:hypothetical protein
MNNPCSEVRISLVKIRWKLFLLGLFKIPLIFFVSPKIISISSETCIVKIKLKRRTKNHINSMYFGALAVGADVAAGIHAYYLSEIYQNKITLAFKSLSAEFLKRAETDVTFTCDEGKKIATIIEKSKLEDQRINDMVEVLAYNSTNEIVAKFKMELSIKVLNP